MARKKQETLVLFPEVFRATEKMSDQQFGVLMRAIFAYRFRDECYCGEDLLVEMIFNMIRSQLDRYKETCLINQNNRNRASEKDEDEESSPNATECDEIPRNDPHTHTRNPNHNPIHTPIPDRNHSHTLPHTPNQGCGATDAPPPDDDPGGDGPTVGQVYEYALVHKLDSVKTLDFWNHYQSNGWKDNKGLPIHDWRALLKQWNKEAAALSGFG